MLAVSLSPEQSRGMLPIREATPAAPRGYAMTDAGIAVVPVLGPLVTRGDWFTAFLGATDYGEIGSTIEAAFADPSARAVLMELDSPGGEVGGLFDLVDQIAALREASGKPLWAVSSENALSAAFAIASAADRLYVTRTGEVGSVGVVAIHVDESVADAQAGIKWTLIHAGAKKVDGNPHEPLSVPAHADIQTDVDALHTDLVTLVATNRGIAPDAVRATEAAIYRGQRGIDAGFADQLGNVSHALTDLAESLGNTRSRPAAPPRGHAALPQSGRSPPVMTTETPAPPADARPATVPETTAANPAEPVTPVVAPAPPAEDRLRAEYAEIAAIAAQAGRLGVTIDAADAMARGIAPHALRRSILDALATRAEASAVVAVMPPGAAAGDSPIVRRARERAAASRS
ncbi:MAG: S49 family peptidase [Geminicoccaceae bacterium]